MSPQLNPYFQVGLDVRDRPCLIIGGGREAADKGGRLLEAGGRLKVVSPRLVPPLQAWAAEGRLQYLPRRWEPGDLDSVFLVLNTVRDPELARQVFALAGERQLLINTYDQPEFSNLGMAALVHPGHLRLSISTSNASPALSRRLRQDLEKLFDGEFAEYLEQLARVRQRLREREPDPKRRIRLLRGLVKDFRLEGKLHYPENWREKVRELLEENGDG